MYEQSLDAQPLCKIYCIYTVYKTLLKSEFSVACRLTFWNVFLLLFWCCCFLFSLFFLSQVSQQFWSDQQRRKEQCKGLSVNRDFLSSGLQFIFGELWMLLLELLNRLEKETPWQKWLSCISFRRTPVRLASLGQQDPFSRHCAACSGRQWWTLPVC